MDKFYITTAIDYVNAKPHIGHAYEKVLADAIARWKRLEGKDVFFLTGTDDNASKNEEAAKKDGVPTKQFVDTNAKYFENLCKELTISYDRFIRTTSSDHVKVAQKFFQKAYDAGDIYKGEYEGLYCAGCEAFYTPLELVDGKCKEHPNRKIEFVKEESYFFKLSKYKDKILSLLENNEFIIPSEWKNEILSRLNSDELKDISVSRLGKEWGIKTPVDPKHSIYVWYDALLNYYTATTKKGHEKYWPPDLQVIGKGINWFHTVIWPAILFSANIQQPKKILVHGYLTMEGKKIGKSVGNVVDPIELIKKYGADALRYYLLRETPIGKDGDFSEEMVRERYNNELANGLGNLVSRTLSMVEKYCDGRVPKGKNELHFDIQNIANLMNQYDLHSALQEIFKLIHDVNKYVNDKKPWEENTDKGTILYTALDSLRMIAILLAPFMPGVALQILRKLGIKKMGKFADIKPNLLKRSKIAKGDILFKKVEIPKTTGNNA